MLSRLIIFLLVSTSLLFADTKSEIDRLFRQASSGEIRFTKLVQPSKDSLAARGDTAAKYLVDKLNTTDAREALTLVDIYRGIGTKSTPYLVAALKTDNKYQLRTTCRCLADVKDSTDLVFDLPILEQLHDVHALGRALAQQIGPERFAIRLYGLPQEPVDVSHWSTSITDGAERGRGKGQAQM